MRNSLQEQSIDPSDFRCKDAIASFLNRACMSQFISNTLRQGIRSRFGSLGTPSEEFDLARWFHRAGNAKDAINYALRECAVQLTPAAAGKFASAAVDARRFRFSAL